MTHEEWLAIIERDSRWTGEEDWVPRHALAFQDRRLLIEAVRELIDMIQEHAVFISDAAREAKRKALSPFEEDK